MPDDLQGIRQGDSEIIAGGAFGLVGDDCPGDSSWSEEGSQIVEQVTFDGGADGEAYWPNLKKKIKELLGVNRRVAGALQRDLPARHPVLHSCVASRITSVKGLGYLGKDKLTGLGKYRRGVMMVVYEKKRYSLLTNTAAGGDESTRFVIKEDQVNVFFVTLQGVEFTFPVVPPAAAGQPFRGTMGKREAELHLTWTWVSVPINAVLSSKGIPTNLVAVGGLLNSVTWQDREPGKVLMEGVKVRHKVAPVEPQEMGLGATDPPILLDVTYSMKVTLTRTSHNYFPNKDGELAIPTNRGGQPVYGSVAYADYVFKPL